VSAQGRRGLEFAASESHRLKNFFQTEFRFFIRPLAWLLTVERIFLFVNRKAVLFSHRDSTGLRSGDRHPQPRGVESVGESVQQTRRHLLTVIRRSHSSRRAVEILKQLNKTIAFPRCGLGAESRKKTVGCRGPARWQMPSEPAVHGQRQPVALLPARPGAALPASA
jgi:hypothetical protein